MACRNAGIVVKRIMLDYLRDLTKSKEEKRQEALGAYLDGALAPGQREQLESDLAQDKGLQLELDQMRLLKQQMRQMPQRRVRRNFVLDPALYGRPRREPLVQAYPVLRTATALAAFFFIFAIAANLFLGGTAGMAPAAEPMMVESEMGEELLAEAAVEESAADSMAMEAVSEAPVEESAADSMAMEAAGDAPFAAEEMAVDSEFEMTEEEAESALSLREMEAEAAMPMESAPPAESAQMEELAEAKDGLAAAPTMAAEATAEAELASELQALPTAVAAESAVQTGPGAVDERRSSDDEGSFGVERMGLVVFLLGAAFVILIILTLVARRRL